MKIFKMLKEFLAVFILVFLIASLMTFLYSCIVHGCMVVDWEIALLLAVIFAVVIPALKLQNPQSKNSP